MEQQTIIFLGPQGSGKGTQAKLIQKFLAERDPSRKTVYFEAGQALREFAQSGNGKGNLAVRDILARGAFVPTFITSSLMTQFFLSELTEDAHLLVDGFPRELRQAMVFDTAVQFYERRNPKLLHVTITEEESITRLLKRGRNDDTEDSIRARLKWNREQVEPMINWFRTLGLYEVLEIDGMPSIEEIHKNILAILGLAG